MTQSERRDSRRRKQEKEITLTTIKNKSSKKPFDLSLAAIDQEKKAASFKRKQIGSQAIATKIFLLFFYNSN